MHPPAPTVPAHLASHNVRLSPQPATDSRGRPTVAVVARLGPHEVLGDCPAGASKGADEARTVPVAAAQAHLRGPLAAALAASHFDLTSPAALAAFDAQLERLAGANFAELGANATLPLSRALWQLGAKLRGEPLAALFRQALAPQKAARPRLLMNIFNGGLHALRQDAGEVLGRDRIDIQEIMVVPVRAGSYREALRQGEAIDAALKARLLAHYGAHRLSRADEAGFSVQGLGDSNAAIAHVFAAVGTAGLQVGRDVQLALDVAASSFYDAGARAYRLGGQLLDTAGMVAWLTQFADRYRGQVFSIEDGLDENDWAGWASLRPQMDARGVHTIGDDLFVTQLPRLQRGIAEQSASAVLIKVNQNGTVGGTLAVMRAARAAGMGCVVSHRSGETLDDTIADLAHGCGALGLKAGDPQPEADFPDPSTWVRRQKYLRLLALEGAP